MCGIAGFVDFNKKSDFNILKNMTDILYHRGPDDSGYNFYQNEYANIGLGHRRLSILDLSSYGHQPMKFDYLEIIYNGEVYNFKEIKQELEKYGYKFESNSDTEVILKSYHKWGIKAIDKFNGMFAMVIYDKKNNKLLFIRDRVGIKPLYYYYDNNLFMFSSELKSFHQHSKFEKIINLESVSAFLQFGYIPEPLSIFKNTYKLNAGYYMELNLKTRELKKFQYWNVLDFYQKAKLRISEDEAIEKTESILKTACEYRMIADVPVGIFLSGGYDSTIVTALLQSNTTKKLKTFTIGFHEEKYNEALYAKKVANYLGTDHTEFYCTESDLIKIIPMLSEIYDEPFGDSSSIATILVSKLAKEKVKVSLSADGGDEIFGGYNKYDYLLKLTYIQKYMNYLPSFSIIPLLKMIHNIGKLSNVENIDTKLSKIYSILQNKNIFKDFNKYFNDNEIKKVMLNFEEFPKTNFDENLKLNILDQMLVKDYKTYLVDDILPKVDRATMSVSLEGREPFLDYRIIEFVSQLPGEYKIRNGEKKWLLKQIVHRYIPKEIMDRPKKGFSIPIFEWLKRNELKELLELYLGESFLNKQNIFNIKEISNLKKEYLSGKKINVSKLWFILIFQMWWEKWM